MNNFFEDLNMVLIDLMSRDKKRIQKQIPNVLTLIRGIIAPIIIIQALIKNSLYLAIILIAICSLTDSLDGWYARKYDAKSELGTLLDTICDKIFSISILVPVVSAAPKYVISIILLEIVIAIINSYFKIMGYETSSSKIGKVKTIMLYLTIVIYYVSLLSNMRTTTLDSIGMYTVIVQIITALDYFKEYRGQETK